MHDRDLVDDLHQFFRDYYREDIGQLAQRYPNDQKSLEIQWRDLYRFNPDLTDDLRNDPGELLDYLEEALRTYDLPLDITLDDANVRVVGVPATEELTPDETRADHLNQYSAIYGQVSKVSQVKPRPEIAAFECQRCGTCTRIPQHDSELQKPHECEGCERQGPFRINLDQSELTNQQLAKIQEPPEQAAGGKGKNINVRLEDDLVNSVQPGDRVAIPGVVRADTDTDDLTFDMYLEANGADVEETDFEDIDVSTYESQIQEIAAGDPIKALRNSLAPKLRGMETEKEAIILQLFGGNRATYPDGSFDRGDFHVLLLGDPGCGKSSLLRAVEQIAPRSTYASGKNASAAGMTAAAVPDDFGDSKWSLEAGALVLANNGVACIDEIDKVNDDARSSLHDALESQKVEVNKADIDATLPAHTALLAAGNPKHGRFEPYEPIAQQIDLGPTLLSRFDLMFMLTDEPDSEEDEEVAKHMIQSRRKAVRYTHKDDENVPSIAPDMDRDLMRAYIAYAKQNINPEIPESLEQRIADWYTTLRMSNADSEDSPVPVTARKVEAIERLAEASARARLSQTVEEQDIERAGDLVMRSMRDVGVDPETGEFDADVVETGQSKSQRDRRKKIKAMIQELEAEYDKGAPIEALLDRALDEDMGKNVVEHDVDALCNKGEIYEACTDHYRTT